MIEKFTRTFHPVGHGAFYTEKIVTDNQKTFNIVYDCGSETWRRSSVSRGVDLRKYIDSVFCEDDVIDLLFISHFHYDHIGGIEFLKDRCKKIEKVIMPLLDERTRNLARISLALEGGNTDIIDNPQSFFGDGVKVIQVNPISDNNNESSDYYLDDIPYDVDIINSGDRLLTNTDWLYIPYNYKQEARFEEFCKKLTDIIEDDENLKEFNEALENPSLTIDIDLVSKIIENTISKNKLIEAYEKAGKIGGGIKEQPLNLTSLILYSGNEKIKLITCNKKFCYERRFWRNSSGCLYLGDTNLNQNNIVYDIKKRLSSLWKTVSIIQIPHHGAEPNYNPAIISSYLKFAVVSCKEGDRLHPSNNVVNNFKHSTGRYLFKVTEEKESIVTQFKI